MDYLKGGETFIEIITFLLVVPLVSVLLKKSPIPEPDTTAAQSGRTGRRRYSRLVMIW